MDEEKPTMQMARDVQFLFCEPAFAGKLTGEKVAVVTFGFLSEVEGPMIIGLADCEKLAVSLLETLAYFGDKKADQIVEQYYPENLRNPDSVTSDVIADKDETVGGGKILSPTQGEIKTDGKGDFSPFDLPTLKIQRQGRIESLVVMGAYQKVPTCKIVLLCVGDRGKATYLLETEQSTKLFPCPRGARLPGNSWREFVKMPDGGIVHLGPWQWRKMDYRAINQIVRGRVFMFVRTPPKR